MIVFRSSNNSIIFKSQNFGYLKITALRNSRPIAALIQAQALDNKARFTAYSEIKPDQPGLRLTPGVYNVIITDKETINGSSVTINNVKIELGKTFEQTVNLSSGYWNLQRYEQTGCVGAYDLKVIDKADKTQKELNGLAV